MFERHASVVALLVLLGSASASAEDTGLKRSGYYKNLLMRSDTLSGEPFTLDMNRLRVEVRGNIVPAVRIDVQYDNELLLGNYLRTAQFQQQRDVPPSQYWRADGNYVEASRFYGTHRLYRASLNISMDDTDVRIGRQRVAWGTGRFWSPLDALNPVSPIAIERDERVGVDAVLIEHKLGALSRLSAVAAPSRIAGHDTVAVQWHANRSGVDYSVLAGRMQGRLVWGLDLAGQVGQVGVRAEVTRERPTGAPAYNRLLLGADYVFTNSFALTGELFVNGAGAADPSRYDFRALIAGDTQALARRYLGVHTAYEMTPLLKWEGDLAINLRDHSKYLGGRLTYSLQTDMDLRIGMQRFSGAPGTEYAKFKNLTYLQVQRFF